MSGLPAGDGLPEGVVALLPEYLRRQRWFGGDQAPDAASVRVLDAAELTATADGAHRLLWAIVGVTGGPPGAASDGDVAEEAADAGAGPPAAAESSATVRYQLLIGERPNGEHAEFLKGHEPSVLGSVDDRYYYDAVVDPELTLAWLRVVTDGSLSAERVRPVNAEQSNTSLVYDDKLIAKLFRRLHEGPNPDVVVTEALARVGFAHVAQPAAVWRRDGTDLAFVQQFLAGGTEGWALALTSLRDLYSFRCESPSEAGGDFAHEASRLGQVTGEMHLAMANAFGVDRDEFREIGWPAILSEIEEQLRAVVGAAFSGSGEELIEELRRVSDPGPAIRVHGDYHLGQVMRTDAGWFVLDFEGEPARAMNERLAFTSPFKDVTGMLRSFHYAAHFALLERERYEQEELLPQAERWEQHNRQAFLDGYFGTPGIGALLPERPEVREAVSLALELQKALYEVAYEQAYRPDWIAIPTQAINRILAGSYHGLAG
ncbi:MAG: maltokinase [Acidimicrobiaceae bacterium]|nr:maltokinase [Acidimicrobiaceae bacterium]